MAVSFMSRTNQAAKLSVQLKTLVGNNRRPELRYLTQHIKSAKLGLKISHQSHIRCTQTRYFRSCHNESLIFSHHFHTSSKCFKNNASSNTPPLPKIFYIPNPFIWMVNKFDLKVLEKAWDPSFSQTEFIRGSKQAVSKVMQLASQRRYVDLQGLLTRTARTNLEMELQNPQFSFILPKLALEPFNFKIATPRKIRFLKYQDRKFCDVDMNFLALKWMTLNQDDGILYVEIFASFRREYTEYSIPEWTITIFKIYKIRLHKRKDSNN